MGNGYHRTVVHAHEIGHVFNADHAYAVEDPPGSGKWTIMRNPFVGDSTLSYFSDGRRDSSKNNVKRMRDKAGPLIVDSYTPVTNVAYNAWNDLSTTCTSFYGTEPRSAIDGSRYTYWWAMSLPCSLTLNLYGPHRISGIALPQAAGYQLSYLTIDVDTSGSGSWVQVLFDYLADQPGHTTNGNYVTGFKPIDAYKIRLNLNAACCGRSDIILYEFEVYRTLNLALQSYGAVASASSTLWGHTAGLANDGGPSSYWWAASTTSSLTIMFDQQNAVGPRAYYVSQIVVRAYSSGYAMPYWELQYRHELDCGGSPCWITIASQSGSPGTVKIYVIQSFYARGIRLLVNGPTCCGGLNSYAVIREFEAYGGTIEPLTWNRMVWEYS